MSDFANAIVTLRAIINDGIKNIDEFFYATQLVADEAGNASDTARNHAIDMLLPFVEKEPSMIASYLALSVGILVEHGAEDNRAFDVIVTRAEEILVDAIRYAHLCVEQELNPHEQSTMEHFFETGHQREADAWHALSIIYRPLIAVASRSTEFRKQLYKRSEFRQYLGLLAGVNEGAFWLDQFCGVLENQIMTVLVPSHQTGYQVRVSGISDTIQLYILLIDAINKQTDAKWVETSTPPAEIADLMQDTVPMGEEDKPAPTITTHWRMTNWGAWLPDGTVDEDERFEIVFDHTKPDDIPTLDRDRVIILDKLPEPKEYHAVRMFPDLPTSIEITKTLNPIEVRNWFERILTKRETV